MSVSSMDRVQLCRRAGGRGGVAPGDLVGEDELEKLGFTNVTGLDKAESLRGS